jgi:outer membrane receptor protein involved in Fe transport
MNKRRSLWLVVIGLVLLGPTAFSQYSSNLQGVVEDPSTARVPGAILKLRNVDTGVTAQAKSNDSGYYRFTSLQPGNYQLSAEGSGFQPKKVDVVLLTGTTTDLNLSLALSSTTETVQVSEKAALLDTAETKIQVVLRAEALRELPVQGRNFLALVAVAPGVTGTGVANFGTGGTQSDNFSNEASPSISGNGRNEAGNSFSVDGLGVDSNITTGTSNFNPNPDMIQEISIQTTSYNVDQGSHSSVTVAMTSKSGTNEFHGTGSYYFTNQNLRAGTEFVHEYQPFKRHDLSGTFGGPIIKNRTFAFASVQPLWSAATLGNNSTTYESPEFLAWAKGAFPDTIGTKILSLSVPTGVSTTGVAKYASDLFPGTCGTAATSNLPCNLPMIDQGSTTPSPYRNGLQYSVRGDQYLRDTRDRLFVNYSRMNLDSQNPAIRSGFESTNNSNSFALQTNWTHTFSASLVNEFSFGGSKVFGQNGAGKPPYRIPDVNITGVGTGISPGWSGNFTQHNYNWKDVVSWIRGSHTIRIGGQYTWGDDWADFSAAYNRPAFNFNSLLDLVQDKPYSECCPAYDPLTGQPSQYIFGGKVTTMALFVQDEWKVKPNLTLTLGVRYDDYGNPTGTHGLKFSNIFLGQGQSIDQQMADGSLKLVQHPYSNSERVFNPRLGVAWSPGKSGKWSIRGGIGLYHDGVTLGEAVDDLRSNPPGLITSSFSQNTPIKPLFSIGTSDKYPFGIALPTIPSGALDSHGGLVGAQAGIGIIDLKLKASSTLNYSLGVERELAGRTVVGLSYSGSRTWDGLEGSDFNRFPGDLLNGTLDRLNPSFGSMQYVFNANSIHYNAMIATVRKEIGSRGSIQASYTTSHVTDFGSGGTRSYGYDSFPDQHVIFDPSQRESLRADSSWDHRHRFALSGTYAIPGPFQSNLAGKYLLGGWQVSLVSIMQTGSPFTVLNFNPFSPILDSTGKVIGLQPGSGDYNADGVNLDYPNFTGTVTNGHSRSDLLNKGIFNLSDFTAPAVGSQGNEKRNSFRNPGYVNFDASMLKNNKFYREKVNLQLRFDFFNVLNHVNLGGVDGNMFSSTFGKVTSTGDPRIIQLGARISF